MFPKKTLLLIIVSLAFSGYIAAQIGNSNTAAASATDSVAAVQSAMPAAVTTTDLRMPKALLVSRVVSSLNSQHRASVLSHVSPVYRRPFNATMMWTGTTNFVAKFVDNSGTIGNSTIFDNSGLVGIGTISPQATLHVAANNTPGLLVEAQDAIEFGTYVCCGAGPTGSSLGSSSGWSSFYNGVFLNSNGTANGGGGGTQINTSLPSWRLALGSGSVEWPGGDNFAIGRVAAGGNYSSPSIFFSISNTGKVKVAGGIDNTGSGVKHVRVQGCSMGTSNGCNTTIQWPGAFADANYTLVCTSQSGVNVGFFNKSATGVTVNLSIQAGGPPPSTGELDCIAMHD